jgi:hypothetical protein
VRKARAEDLTALEFAHVDIDTDANGNRLTTDEQKAAAVEPLRGCTEPGLPSFIISSGNGIRALWHLFEGVSAAAHEASIPCRRRPSSHLRKMRHGRGLALLSAVPSNSPPTKMEGDAMKPP